MIIHAEEDIYDAFLEDDYSTATENFISNDNFAQVHNFEKSGDADWAMFNADTHLNYDIYVTNQAPHCDAALYLYHESDMITPVLFIDDWHPPSNGNEIAWWNSGEISGTMFVKITQSPFSPGWFGEETTYTLKVFSPWGPSTGLATITGTSAVIGPPGGSIKAGVGGQYIKPELNIPAGALDSFVEFLLEDPGDIGNKPEFPCTIQWLDAHPTNATIARVYAREPVSFNLPATLTLQFIDDGPVLYGFTIDDVPSGKHPSDMRIYSWDDVSWMEMEHTQNVLDDTVSVQISNLEREVFAVAPSEKSRIDDWTLY